MTFIYLQGVTRLVLRFGERSARDDLDSLPLGQSSWPRAYFQLSRPHCLRRVYPKLRRPAGSVGREFLFSLIFVGEPVTRFGMDRGYLRQATCLVDREFCFGSKKDRVVHNLSYVVETNQGVRWH